MRKLMTAVVVTMGLGLAVGCERRGEVQQERQDVAEAQQQVQQERQETQEELAETRQEAQEELGGAQQEVQEEQQELTQAQQEQLQEGQGVGGTGMAAGQQEVEGRVQSATPDAVILITEDDRQMRFQAGAQTQVRHEGRQVSLQTLQPGDEVRASFRMDKGGNMVLNSIEVQKKGQEK
jgi:F0F1-type ATP synthase membrane subunit b/b'